VGTTVGVTLGGVAVPGGAAGVDSVSLGIAVPVAAPEEDATDSSETSSSGSLHATAASAVNVRSVEAKSRGKNSYFPANAAVDRLYLW
jgi:hypothetical protein